MKTKLIRMSAALSMFAALGMSGIHPMGSKVLIDLFSVSTPETHLTGYKVPVHFDNNQATYQTTGQRPSWANTEF